MPSRALKCMSVPPAHRSRAAMSPTTEVHSARYFALLYSPPARRAVIQALFGIEREVFESLRPGLDHHVAHSRLQWWREECERAGAGQAQHPLTRELLAAIGDVPHTESAAQPPNATSARERTTAAATVSADAKPLVDFCG